MSSFTATWLALTLVLAAYAEKSIWAGIASLPRGQSEAARSTGLSWGQTMAAVILPQALRMAVPPLTNRVISITKNRQATIRTQPGGLRAVAMPGASAAVGLQQAQGELGADELLQVEIGGDREGIDVEMKVVIDAFLAVEAFHHQGFGQAIGRCAVQGDEARMLRQAGAEQGGDDGGERIGTALVRIDSGLPMPGGNVWNHGIAST